MEVRQTGSDDWATLRRLRLRALADAPGAFASTLEAELAFPDDVWRAWAGHSSTGPSAGPPTARPARWSCG